MRVTRCSAVAMLGPSKLLRVRELFFCLSIASQEKVATVEDVWKFLDGDISKEPYSAISVVMGATGSTKPALLGMVTEEEAESTIQSAPMSLVAKSVTRQVSHICRMASGVTAPREAVRQHSEKLQKELVELKGARVASSAEENRVKLNTIFSQTSETEVPILDPEKVNLAYARYQAVYGAKSVPPPDAEPTTEQLSGLAQMLATWASLADGAAVEVR